MERISNESAVLVQCVRANPVSMALTVFEIQLTKVKPIAMNFSLLDELISGNGYISRTVSATNSRDGSAYCSRRTDSFDMYIVLIARESDLSYFYPNIVVLLSEY